MAETTTFSFTPNKSDYVRSLRAFYFRQRTTRIFMLILLVASLCSIVAPLWLNYIPFYSLFLPMFMIFYFLFLFFMIPVNAGDKVEKNERLRSEITWELDEQQVSLKTTHSEAKFDWGTFGEAFETDEHFMIAYAVNKNMFQIVPKRAFPTAGQQDEFRKILEKKVRSVTPIRSIYLPEPSRSATIMITVGIIAILIIISVVINFQ